MSGFVEYGGQSGVGAGAGPAQCINAPTQSSNFNARVNAGAAFHVSGAIAEDGERGIGVTISPEAGASITVTQVHSQNIGNVGPIC